MKKIILCAILILAIGLRFYKLGVVPASMDWDEVSLGYNAYTLLLTGADEYGNSWPLSIRSFNDYKPPAYTYLDIVPTAIFGLNEFGTRFPAAFFGSLAVIGVYFLTKEMFKNSAIDSSGEKIGLIAMAVFAISPWHLQFSRAAFEGNIAVFFVIWAVYFLLKWFNTKKMYAVYLAVLFFAGSLYAYHAARLIAPLLLLGFAIRYRAVLATQSKKLIIPTIIGIILCIPLFLTLLRGSASERFSSVSIFSPTIEILRPLEYERQDLASGRWDYFLHNRRVEYSKEFIEGYINHFNPINMFLKGDVVARHHAPDVGLFYLVEFPLLLIGINTLLKKRFNYKFLFFFWAAIAPLPAAISTGTPHAIRSILFLPIPQIAVAVGILTTIQYFRRINIKVAYSVAVIAILYAINIMYYFNQYYVQMDTEYAEDWQTGYRELVKTVKTLEPEYDKVIITPAYDQPYIYFLYYKKYDPHIWVNNGEFNKGFDKYEFRKINWGQDRLLHKTLIVGDKMEVPLGEPGMIKVIRTPDNKKDVFRIISSQY